MLSLLKTLMRLNGLTGMRQFGVDTIPEYLFYQIECIYFLFFLIGEERTFPDNLLLYRRTSGKVLSAEYLLEK